MGIKLYVCRFCWGCLSEAGLNRKCIKCTIEGETYILDPSVFSRDPAMEREIYQLDARCDSPTCPWTGKFKEYLKHLQSCEFKLIKCVCECMIAVKDMTEHALSGCTLRRLVCSYCRNGDVIARDMGQHLNTCPKYPISCPNDCGMKLERESVPQHVATACVNLPCKFGCEEHGFDHGEAAVVGHTKILLEMVTVLQTTIENGAPFQRSLLQQKLVEIETRMDEIKATIESHQVNRRSLRLSHHNLESLKEKQTVIEGIVAVLNREVEKLINDQTNLAHQRALNASAVDQIRGSVTSMERSLALKDISLAEQELRLKELESTVYDGNLTWVIHDVTRRRQEAINGRTPSIYSTPFYTSRAGYKMCVRIYLNGDGMGKGTHISLFFVLMRGQYDAILPWPFKQKVTLMLLDQNNREHVIDAFRADPSSSSFRRPQSVMNIASGVPLFCPLSRLEDRRYSYVKDDTMFVKIMADTE